MRDISSGESFTDFYEDNSIYIDKTKEIYSLIKYKRAFFSRPRRFGKSTVLDTIATLFENGIDPYFKDTWIYDKWTENTYPVLRLNFLEFSNNNFDKFCNDFYKTLNLFIEDNNFDFEIDYGEPYQCLKILFARLRSIEQKIVILIDEYDCQLTANINNPELYNKFQETIRNFYAVIKGKK